MSDLVFATKLTICVVGVICGAAIGLAIAMATHDDLVFATALAVCGAAIGLPIATAAHWVRRSRRALIQAWDRLITHVADIDLQVQEIRKMSQRSVDEATSPVQGHPREEDVQTRQDLTSEPTRAEVNDADDADASNADDDNVGFPSFTVTPEEWRALCHASAHPRVLPEEILRVFQKRHEIGPEEFLRLLRDSPPWIGGDGTAYHDRWIGLDGTTYQVVRIQDIGSRPRWFIHRRDLAIYASVVRHGFEAVMKRLTHCVDYPWPVSPSDLHVEPPNASSIDPERQVIVLALVLPSEGEHENRK